MVRRSRLSRSDGKPRTSRMKVNVLKEMDGNECWTDAFGKRFGERVCVLVQYPYVIHDGKKFKPTSEEKKALWDDFVFQELGSKEQIKAELEEEFGGSK